LSNERFECTKAVSQLFTADDYFTCDDQKIVAVYKRLRGEEVDDKLVDISNYYLTDDGYLMHLDKVTNMMATVIPTKSAQEQLVRTFHLQYDNHPHGQGSRDRILCTEPHCHSLSRTVHPESRLLSLHRTSSEA